MTKEELKDIIEIGETTTAQFKSRLESHGKDAIADEMVAMANTLGGDIVFGVDDKTGELRDLNFQELQTIGNALSSIASDKVVPPIYITTEVVKLDDKKILVAHVPEGVSKPYKNNYGVIFVKQAADKRRVTDNSEIMRLFQSSGTIYADEMTVSDTGIEDVDMPKVLEYAKKIDPDITIENIDATLLRNINVMKNGKMTLGGLLFFAKEPQRFRPSLLVKAVAFYGNSLGDSDYRDSEDIDGTIPEMFKKSIAFFKRNLHHVQAGQNFNSVGILEISEIALQELLQNAFTHRDYTRNAPIRLLIFDDRVEIISPGRLPNSQTIDNIKMGNTIARNSLVVTFASRMMKYRGLGTGIIRALKEQPNIEFINDREGDQFIVRISREEY